MALRNDWPDDVLGMEYPFEDRVLRLRDGPALHYVESGYSGVRRPTFLLVPGAPAWSYLFRRVVKPLGREGRVVAVDPVGLGRSDHPGEPGLYALERRIAQLEDVAAQLRLRRVIPVAHGAGVVTAVGYALRNPQHVEGLVLLNGWVPGVPRPLGFAERLMGLTRLSRLGWSERAVLTTPRLEKGELGAMERAGYAHPFPSESSRAGLRILARGLRPSDDPLVARIAADCPAFDRPVQVVWGEQDGVLGRAYASRAASRFPKSQPPVLVPGAGYWLPEQAPDAVADHTLAFARSL